MKDWVRRLSRHVPRRIASKIACAWEWFISRGLRILLLAAIGYGAFIFHGLSSHLDPWSQALINAIVKYSYPKTGQEDITVVLFREENLADLKTHYPVPYRVHTQIIETLATYSPDAVFIDFAFIDQRDEQAINELGDALCLLKEFGSRVFIAAPTPTKLKAGDKKPEIAPTLSRCAQPAMPEMDSKTGESGVLTYFNGRWDGEHFIPSAAFALAEERIQLPPQKGSKLEIIWGKGVAPLNEKWMDCEDKPAIEVLHDTLFENPLANRLDCPYHRTISAHQLLNSVGDPDIENAIKGKTIFYGGGFRFTGDRVESPVYGEMPGVYLHAMAYDNLLSYKKEHYKRADRKGTLVTLIDITLLLVAAGLLVCVPRKERDETQSLISFLEHSLVVAVASAFTLLVMAVVLTLCGLDIACLTGAALYVLYRSAIQHDWAFLTLAVLTVATSLLCFEYLNLGPRNILAFIAFFEVVEHFQEKLIKKAKTYYEIREHYLTAQITEEQGATPPLPWWDWVLKHFFQLFYRPNPQSQEHAS